MGTEQNSRELTADEIEAIGASSIPAWGGLAVGFIAEYLLRVCIGFGVLLGAGWYILTRIIGL